MELNSDSSDILYKDFIPKQVKLNNWKYCCDISVNPPVLITAPISRCNTRYIQSNYEAIQSDLLLPAVLVNIHNSGNIIRYQLISNIVKVQAYIIKLLQVLSLLLSKKLLVKWYLTVFSVQSLDIIVPIKFVQLSYDEL